MTFSDDLKVRGADLAPRRKCGRIIGMSKKCVRTGSEHRSEGKVATTWPGCRPLRHPHSLTSSRSWAMFSSLWRHTMKGSCNCSKRHYDLRRVEMTRVMLKLWTERPRDPSMARCHSELNITQLREEVSERGWRSGRHPGQVVATFPSLLCSNPGARTFFTHSNYPPTPSPGCTTPG